MIDENIDYTPDNQNEVGENFDGKGLMPKEHEIFKNLYEEISKSVKDPNNLQRLLIERICIRIIQLKRLNFVSKEYWTSLFVPEILEPVMLEVSLIHYVKQKAYDPKVNFKSLSKIANEIHALEASIENQIIKMKKALK